MRFLSSTEIWLSTPFVVFRGPRSLPLSFMRVMPKTGRTHQILGLFCTLQIDGWFHHHHPRPAMDELLAISLQHHSFTIPRILENSVWSLKHQAKQCVVEEFLAKYPAAPSFIVCLLLAPPVNLETSCLSKSPRIRAHMASIGLPIVGDATYGRCPTNKKRWKQLNKRKSIFDFPSEIDEFLFWYRCLVISIAVAGFCLNLWSQISESQIYWLPAGSSFFQAMQIDGFFEP